MNKAKTLVFILLQSGLGFLGYAETGSGALVETISYIVSPTRTTLAGIENAIQVYAMQHHGKLPVSLDELVESDDTDRPPLLKKKDILDSWGEPIEYECEESKYILRSSGPDRKMGTADDILEGDIESYQRGWKSKQPPPVVGQETNAVQGVTVEPVRPKGWNMKPEEIAELRESVLATREKAERVKRAKANLIQWQLPLLIGIAAVGGVVMAWRHLKRKKR